MTTQHLHIGVSLDGAGRHPAAWRHAGSEPDALFGARRIVDLVRLAERGRLDFVTLDDSFDLQSDREDEVRGSLDALLTLARVAPVTSSIGLVPTVTTTHTEPFHVSKNLATLDLVSLGRAGWMVAVSPSAAEAQHFGRRDPAPAEELFAEAGEAMDVVGRLWDSWEDDAVIRDIATGRYIDRSKLHTTDFEGRYFSVRGPSITPRSPQGRSVVMIESVDAHALRVGIEWADVIVIEVANIDEARAIRGQIEQGLRQFDRDPGEVAVLASVDALLEPTDAAAQRTRAELDARAAAPPAALSFDGTGAGLAELLGLWAEAGVVDGFVLRPATLPATLAEFVEHTVPALQAADLFRVEYEGTTLREHFGLKRPTNCYATTAGSGAGA